LAKLFDVKLFDSVGRKWGGKRRREFRQKKKETGESTLVGRRSYSAARFACSQRREKGEKRRRGDGEGKGKGTGAAALGFVSMVSTSGNCGGKRKKRGKYRPAPILANCGRLRYAG